MQTNFQSLYRTLNYEFKQVAYLKQALTHCSADTANNERFEFLGDSILSVVIAHALFEKFPEYNEGTLSRLRAYLVKGEMLATIALEINLGNYLYLGQGELKSGGFRRASILADALEAVFAAIFLDGGFEASQTSILHLYASRLNQQRLHDNLQDAKTKLQEHLQSLKIPLPNYSLNKVLGEEHDQVFHVSCSVANLGLTTHGHAETRRKAEQIAAQHMMDKILKSG